MKATEQRVLERLRKICLTLAGTEEKLSHGHPSFKTIHGIYAVIEEYRGELSICVKVGVDVQGVFLEDPRFYLTPYTGRLGWVSLKVHAALLDWNEISELLKGSYGLTASAKKKKKKP
jgi:predicted DNA-binding protein (MmcQ/YjbR family)